VAPLPAAGRPIPDDGPRAAGGGARATGSGFGVVVLPAPIPVPPPAAGRPIPEPEPRINTVLGPDSAREDLPFSAFRRDSQVDRGWSASRVSREHGLERL